jgi:triosephosphate isomerase
VLIAGNWKMNHGPAEAERFFSVLGDAPQAKGLSACVLTPAVTLTAALALGRKHGVAVGAQNAHWEKSGAFTGELSGPLLKEIGIETVLTGHSERRQYFGETDETVRKRTESLLAQGFRVIACVGETRAEREAGRTLEVLERQTAVLKQAVSSDRLVLAYEPVWAIGTGLTATPEQAQEAHAAIRRALGGIPSTPLLYGGSVTPDNLATLLGCPDIDGALVGGASLKPESFRSLLHIGAQSLS